MFFQFEMHGGIFQSCWSLTVILRGGECITGAGGEGGPRGTRLCLNLGGSIGSSGASTIRITRADAPEPGDDNDPMMGTTMSLSGHLSKTKVSECMYTSWGPVPEFMFDDREKMRSLSDWFEKYGRPTPNAINLGPRQLYTHYDKSTRRCCGEESHVTRMHKGFLTA